MKNCNNRIEFTEIFTNPPSEFRGAPFWAWNTKPNQKELLRQIACFYDMGFGGFFMHSRAGMATEYLGEAFMDDVRACVKQAKQLHMQANLYDEDRWPSGFAGGYVTKEKGFRQKQICLSLKSPEEFLELYQRDERDPQVVCAFDIVFDECDRLLYYSVISSNDRAQGEKWWAYKIYKPCCGYHNGYTYADTLNPKAVDKFIEVTHEKYKKEIGEEFGKGVPAIFTDEPNYGRIFLKAFARDGEDAFFPWTESFPQMYFEIYKEDIVSHLPELVWNLHNDTPSAVRYRFYRLMSELFSATYCDKIGKWCQDNGIALVGHTLDEDSLYRQMCAVGESMRNYKEFTVPGVDMLCNDTEFTTAKQAQSVAHQYGRIGVMTELYGVTGWDFDFRGHKFQGDWQAALGATQRVLHLSWLSMQGAAKRDYPASIGCQSAWYKEYAYIENHFARLNVALRQGNPIVNVAVLHPIESMWLAAGVREHSDKDVNALEAGFKNITEWLLRGQIDFDYVSESLLPDLYFASDANFCLGKMRYKTVLIPPITTIRKTTIDALDTFVNKGGRLIVCGSCPRCVDGQIDNKAYSLWQKAQKAEFTEASILTALELDREIIVCGSDGTRKRNLLYTLRRCEQYDWLFLAHCDMPNRVNGNDCRREEYAVKVKGTYRADVYNTIDGTVEKAMCEYKNGETIIKLISYPFDSFLLRLTACEKMQGEKAEAKKIDMANNKPIYFSDFVDYALSEPNVFVLDMAEWSRDGKHYAPREEILRIDKAIREELKYPLANGEDMQPWCLPSKPPTEFVYLRFTIKSETAADCALGYEYAQAVWLNGEKVSVQPNGYYVDKAIHTMPLPPLAKGNNELILLVPISERISLENCFLLGNFGVSVTGSHAKITELPEKLAFGSVTNQGLPFYGAAITYKLPFTSQGEDITVTADEYAGALVSVRLDGKDVGKIVLPPYRLQISDVSVGEHVLELTLYASRQNTFGALHLATPIYWKGPNMWYTENNMYSEEYCVVDVGIMKKPKLQTGLL